MLIKRNFRFNHDFNQLCNFVIFSRTPERLAMKGLIIFFLACGCSSVQIKSVTSATDECSLTPVIHVLQYPGCVPKPIPSFACIGKCGSYVQVSFFYENKMSSKESFYIFWTFFKVSGSKIWQMERSCNCCQESGEREASVSLFCPKAKPGERKFRKVSQFQFSHFKLLFQFLCTSKWNP